MSFATVLLSLVACPPSPKESSDSAIDSSADSADAQVSHGNVYTYGDSSHSSYMGGSVAYVQGDSFFPVQPSGGTIGDLTGDGYDDILVGQPCTNGAKVGTNCTPSVYLLSADSGVVFDDSSTDVSALGLQQIVGEVDSALGFSSASAGNDYFVVSAPFEKALDGSTGLLYVYDKNAPFGSTAVQALTQAGVDWLGYHMYPTDDYDGSSGILLSDIYTGVVTAVSSNDLNLAASADVSDLPATGYFIDETNLAGANVTGNAPQQVDLDGDGISDFFVGSFGAGGIFFLGSGLQPGQTISSNDAVYLFDRSVPSIGSGGLTFADYDADGTSDIVAAAPTDNLLYVLYDIGSKLGGSGTIDLSALKYTQYENNPANDPTGAQLESLGYYTAIADSKDGHQFFMVGANRKESAAGAHVICYPKGQTGTQAIPGPECDVYRDEGAPLNVSTGPVLGSYETADGPVLMTGAYGNTTGADGLLTLIPSTSW